MRIHLMPPDVRPQGGICGAASQPVAESLELRLCLSFPTWPLTLYATRCHPIAVSRQILSKLDTLLL